MRNNTTIILVHGAWGEGGIWGDVIRIIDNAGYKVRAAQLPLTSLLDDVNRTTDLIDKQDENVILVGFSYGGAVITSAGINEKVVGLVYISAFAPDEGESINSLNEVSPSIYLDGKDFYWVKYDQFHKSFCEDLPKEEALEMSLSQKPTDSRCFSDIIMIDKCAWKFKPSWYQVSDKDKMIPPISQQAMAERIKAKKIIHINSSHLSMLTNPQEVSSLILDAASSFSPSAVI